jgi:hypothetical protein
MSHTALAVNGLLAFLLLITLAFGWRLDRRLKALKNSHADFAKAVADLDHAANQTSNGLADLRATSDEAIDLLSGRIDKARDLAAKLEALNAHTQALIDRAEVQARALREAPAPRVVAARPAPPRAPEPAERTPSPLADPLAAVESLIQRISEHELLDAPAPARPAPRPARARGTPADDDLFDGPARPRPISVPGARR